MKTGMQRRHSSEKSGPGLTNAPQLAILSWKKAVKGSSTLIADAQRGAGWWKASGRGSGSRPGALFLKTVGDGGSSRYRGNERPNWGIQVVPRIFKFALSNLLGANFCFAPQEGVLR